MWLSQQSKEKLEHWVRHTKTPMLATLPDGSILWTNTAFETLLGYTKVELAGQKTWIELTKPDENLGYDRQMVEQVVAGTMTDYQLQKQYLTKSGSTKTVVIDVLRYPTIGPFECFLVAVVPVDRGVELAIGQLSEIRKLILKMIEKEPKGLTFDKLMGWTKEHPLVAAIIGTLFAFLLFGERVFEILKLFGVGQGGE